jgi:hypothetical protein
MFGIWGKGETYQKYIFIGKKVLIKHVRGLGAKGLHNSNTFQYAKVSTKMFRIWRRAFF